MTPEPMIVQHDDRAIYHRRRWERTERSVTASASRTVSNTDSRQIPIACDAPSRQTSRGFLPWRFADAGPGVRGAVIMGRHPKTFTITDSCTAANGHLFDHLVGELLELPWDFEAN